MSDRIMSKALIFRLHRWVALAFAAPLLAVIGSGLVLSLEPALKAAAPAGTVTLARLEAVLDAAGPAARNAALSVQAHAGTVTLGGRGAAQVFDLATATPAAPGPWPGIFATARRLHETLLLDLGWLVTVSTAALILLAPLGLLLGWPRFRNTVGGWHRATGWLLLPLLVGSPLTGLALALGLSFAAPAVPAAGPAPELRTTLRWVAERHGLDGLDWVRPRGGATTLRVLDASGTSMVYRVGAEGVVAQPRPWMRVLHEGTWLGIAGSVANLVASAALLGLLGTGVWIWLRRIRLKRRARAAALAA
ncbi:PepSY domain-containing protein [Falsiroseomonas sp. CW058]|uniref:PepSY domain-containing protein n=1 Tax=Falsiroseomonas sp. CW058 TaxID=3388664 RepID=UPI003D31267B